MPVEQLRRRLYALAFVDEFGPLYALFTLWFNDNGVKTSQISIVFLLWAAIVIVLEIPSGALADRVDRRHLIAVAFGLRALGISVWMLSPTFAGMLVGAVLWAVHSSLASGAWEALIHDELAAVDAQGIYARVMARVGQFSNLGVAAGALVATPLLGVGIGIDGLGWMTITIHLVSIGVILSLPDVRWVIAADAGHDHAASWSYAAWWATLRSGVTTARRTPQLLRLIAVSALLEGLIIFDEYVPLLARGRGASDSLVPIVYLAVWVGLLVGGEVAARRTQLRGLALGLTLLVGTAAIGAAIMTDPLWTLALVGVGYATLETAWVLSDARLQERLSAATRATVTSVRSFNSGIVSAVAFAMIGLMTNGDDPAPGLIVALGALAATALLMTRWIPNPARRTAKP